MKANIYWAIWPITATAAFFGLALIEYPLGKPRRRLSLVYASVAISMHIGTYMVNLMQPQSERTILVKSVSDFMMLSCTIVVLVSIYLTHWHGKRYHKCMKRFNEVDETLRDLGLETNYSKLRRIGLVGLVTWTIICIVLDVMNTIRYRNRFTDKRYPLLIFCALTPLHARMLVHMQFWSLLGYAGMRFDCISDALKKLTIDDNNCANWFRNSEMISVRGAFVLDERARRIIWTVIHLHFQICEILRDINTVFETQVCLQMGFDCVFLLCNTVFAVHMTPVPFKSDMFIKALLSCLWMFPYFAEIIVTNHVCESVGAKARTVSDMAVQLLRFMDDENMREDISFIVLQAKLRPLRFSCVGLCYFGYHFMYKIFSTVITNALIILQLKAGLQ